MRKILPFLFLPALLAGGCGKQMDVIIRHPLQAGVVDQPNTIERRNGYRATLVALDADRVCFDVSYSLRQAHTPPDASLPSQALAMNADGRWYRDAQVMEVRQPQVSTYQGTVAQRYQAGTVTECVDRDPNTQQCNRWEQRPRYLTRYVPATYYQAVGGGVVCFPNQGRVTIATERVAVRVNRAAFRWGLESILQDTSGGEDTQQAAN